MSIVLSWMIHIPTLPTTTWDFIVYEGVDKGVDELMRPTTISVVEASVVLVIRSFQRDECLKSLRHEVEIKQCLHQLETLAVEETRAMWIAFVPRSCF